ncbi:MAG TPA: VOC family protein, partial [Roseiflexaceae bacterium]|nr:VOC family protein [Roseiflexaceae bacterium]
IHGLVFLICPNTLANVEASQSRHQLTYTVSDVASITQRALDAGGTLIEQDAHTVVVSDPDGNSIVFRQGADAQSDRP